MNKQEVFTEQNIVDAIDTACYGGITYWVDKASIDATARTFTIHLPDGVEEEDETRVIPFDDIREAYFKLLELDQKYVNSTIHGYFIHSFTERTSTEGAEMGNIDADAADVLIQVAAFGEVVFG